MWYFKGSLLKKKIDVISRNKLTRPTKDKAILCRPDKGVKNEEKYGKK